MAIAMIRLIWLLRLPALTATVFLLPHGPPAAADPASKQSVSFAIGGTMVQSCHFTSPRRRRGQQIIAISCDGVGTRSMALQMSSSNRKLSTTYTPDRKLVTVEVWPTR